MDIKECSWTATHSSFPDVDPELFADFSFGNASTSTRKCRRPLPVKLGSWVPVSITCSEVERISTVCGTQYCFKAHIFSRSSRTAGYPRAGMPHTYTLWTMSHNDTMCVRVGIDMAARCQDLKRKASVKWKPRKRTVLQGNSFGEVVSKSRLGEYSTKYQIYVKWVLSVLYYYEHTPKYDIWENGSNHYDRSQLI